MRMSKDDVERIVAEARAEGRVPDLSDVDLSLCYLTGADLYGADLRGADLRGAHLGGAFWDGLVIDNAHPYRCLLAPTPDGWVIKIGYWEGTIDQLQTLIDGDDWPESTGEKIIRFRPVLQAAIHLMRAHIDSRPHVIDDLRERWGSE